MPKMESAGKVRQISLAQIKETDNVRTDYADIEELAESIRTVGLIEPVAVKLLGKDAETGLEEYELVAGYRRHRAFRHLCDKGEAFTMIDAVVVQGDKLTIQLVENLQRADLSPRDREAGIFQLAEAGYGTKEIASRLSKGEPFISRNITACKIRCSLIDEAEKAKDENWLAAIYDLSTQVLNEIAGVKKSDLVSLVRKVVDEGGTVAVARRIVREYNGKAAPPLIPPKEVEPVPAKESAGEAAAVQGGDAVEPGDMGEPSPPPKSAPAKKPAEKPKVRRIDDPPPHKMVDLNSVQAIIKEYIDLIGETEAGASYQYKTEAAYEIWAHLLKGL